MDQLSGLGAFLGLLILAGVFCWPTRRGKDVEPEHRVVIEYLDQDGRVVKREVR